MTNFLLALITLKLFDKGHGNNEPMTLEDLKIGLLLLGGFVLFIAVVCFFGFELVLGFSGVVLVLLSLEKAGILEKRTMKEELAKPIHPIYNILLLIVGLGMTATLLICYIYAKLHS
ncbi:MAG: hypothetical protein V8T90_12950 [Victivallales bacterium]